MQPRKSGGGNPLKDGLQTLFLVSHLSLVLCTQKIERRLKKKKASNLKVLADFPSKPTRCNIPYLSEIEHAGKDRRVKLFLPGSPSSIKCGNFTSLPFSSLPWEKHARGRGGPLLFLPLPWEECVHCPVNWLEYSIIYCQIEWKLKTPWSDNSMVGFTLASWASPSWSRYPIIPNRLWSDHLHLYVVTIS